MKELNSMALKYQDGKLLVLDQQMLPHQEKWIESNTPEEMAKIILDLKTRGAPLIGVAAALSLALYAENESRPENIIKKAELLRSSRPTAVNLMNALDRLLAVGEKTQFNSKDLTKEAENIFEEDTLLCEKMAEIGAKLVGPQETILTHCNTGGLATVGRGTALGVISKAFELHEGLHVYVDETRPLLQGGRLTTWELEKLNIPYTLICDNMAAHLMSLGKIDKIFVGADRIATNGDFANKIGTYSLAVNAKFHNVPFYVVAPTTTLDNKGHQGKDIPIEQREADEVRGVNGHFGKVIWGPEEAPVYNPAFDVTPHELVTGYILDKGLFRGPELSTIRK
ncbi:MAG: S-methyl-5-thioribose-1-phosphate isomerase [Bdellovibrionota bacterium]|nr:S-methyl-5-thioribose-1-phosphate isomerase [Bdellovibrionota bacterium]